MIKDLFKIMLNAAEVKILYISFPKPASAVFPSTKPCRQNCSGGSSRIAEAPAKTPRTIFIIYIHIFITLIQLKRY